MNGNLKVALSLCFLLAVHLSFALKVSDAQNCPTPNPDSRFLTGPEFLTNRYTDAGQIRAKLQQLGSWLAGDDVGDGKIYDVDPINPPRIDFAQLVFDWAKNPTGAPLGQERPINPDLLLATVQNENGLLIKQERPRNDVLTHIMNCRKPSTIRAQIQCAAEALRAGLNGFDVLVATGAVAPCRVDTPWGVDRISKTRDGGVSVKPRNAATGAIFVYTNEAGWVWGGNERQTGGSAEFCRTWYSQRYRDLDMFANPPVDLTMAPTNPTLACGAPDAQRNATLSVAGGTPGFNGYTWTPTWPTTSGTLTVCGKNGEDVILKPPANTGTTVPGVAYIHVVLSGVNNCTATDGWYIRGGQCDDTLIPGGGTPPCFTTQDPAPPCSTSAPMCNVHGSTACPSCGVQCEAPISLGTVCDTRSDSMKAANCNPCVGVMTGATVTVSDNVHPPVTRPITVQR